MSFKSKSKKIKAFIKSKIFNPAVFNFISLKMRSHEMTSLQAECARASLTQYLECLTIAKLRKKFRKQIKNIAQNVKEKNYTLLHDKPKRIWICWLQGIENAPPIVRMCYQSALDTFCDYDITLIKEDNYKDFVDIPESILDKFKKGIISRTHFSDILRLELLIKYGGIWVDATLFFSGKKLPTYMTEDDLFVFQSIWPQLFGRATRMESWFISACKNNPLLIFTRDLLYFYWSKFNCLIDYWLIYDLFEFAIEQFPNEWERVIPVSQCDVHILQDKLLAEYNKEVFDVTISRVPMHKLNWRYTKDDLSKPNTYYQYLINNFKIYSEEDKDGVDQKYN